MNELFKLVESRSSTNFFLNDTAKHGFMKLTLYFIMKAKMRSKTWWVKYFMQTNLEENEPVIKKFEEASSKMTFQPTCQVFHLKPYH